MAADQAICRPFLHEESNDADEYGVSATAVNQDGKSAGPKNDLQADLSDNRKPKRAYLIWAALGAILMSLSAMIRGVESAKPLPAKFTLSLSYLILSALMILYYRCKLGDDFRAPWYKDSIVARPSNDSSNAGVKREFSGKQFFAIILGGMSEFVASIAVILCFNAAQVDNINQGIGTSIMILNGPIVTILSFCLLREMATRTQVFGIITVVVGVTIVSVFGPEPAGKPAQAGLSADKKASEGASAMFLVVMWGVIGAIVLSIQIMTNKWLMVRRGIFGNITGLFFMLTEGTVGTFCLLITTLAGSGLHELSFASFWMLLLGGLLAFSALIIMNFAIASGNAGVAISIFNVNPSLQVILSSTFLRQIITHGQVCGVVLSLVGACILSLGDMCLSKFCKAKQTTSAQ